ncbi:MAG: hypothetical protein EXR92_02090 [Gemmatimonadetes bacterium]|nr:hypothetical protein [Gemmatimonadota bacterium]
MNRARTVGAGGVLLVLMAMTSACAQGGDEAAAASGGRMVPKFQVDPTWPTIPNGWILGEVSSVAVDDQDHVWVLHRPGTLTEEEAPRSAPAVLEFDQDGKFVQGWGGKAMSNEKFTWPETEHGVYVDYQGFVWLGGNATNDQVLKFTKTGEFVMKIGSADEVVGNSNPRRFGRAADTFVYPPTNELFVADGYGNRRVIVFDATSGEFKRMWGAFGNVPTDGTADPEWAKTMVGDGPPQFSQPVHAARVSNDGLVYVSDRGGKRVQVFNIDGTYVTQVWIGRECLAPVCGNGNTVASTAFSPDPEQQFLYVGNRSQARVMVLDRKTLEVLDWFGGWGSSPGQFGTLHHMDTDSQGNIYVTEVSPLTPGNRRVQKFVFVGMLPLATPSHM